MALCVEIGGIRCYDIGKPGPASGRRAIQEENVLSDVEPAAGFAAAPGAALKSAQNGVSSEQLLDHVLTSLDDDKAEEIVTIPLRGLSEMADYMVVCSGRSSRQVSAIAEKLVDRLKDALGRGCKVEGQETGDWVLIDVGDIIVHVFRPEVRDFYQLEKMWMPAAQRSA